MERKMIICCNKGHEPAGIWALIRENNLFGIIVHKIRSIIKYSGSEISVGEEQKVKRERNQLAESILDNYGNMILRYAYSYLHNLSDAEEILQDTVMKYLDKRPVFKNKAHERAWLFTVAANFSKNRIDYNRIRQTDELEESLAAEQQEDLSFVWEAVKTLPEKYREVIHLFYYEGYKTAQISQILHRKESTVRSDLRRGREKLKDVLKEVYDFE